MPQEEDPPHCGGLWFQGRWRGGSGNPVVANVWHTWHTWQREWQLTGLFSPTRQVMTGDDEGLLQWIAACQQDSVGCSFGGAWFWMKHSESQHRQAVFLLQT